ncbi:hypothetical protein ScPMuIL_006650 [Solemya velum]
MNILPHKSWHVRRRDNIERVRKDEAKAAEEEKERQRRIALAEQEARIELLRTRKRKSISGTAANSLPAIPGPQIDAIQDSGDTDNEQTPKSQTGRNLSLAADIYTASGHMNFFKDEEEGIVKNKTNIEHEKEKKAEKEAFEKKIGLLTYLGQSSIESAEKPPWYLHRSREEEKDTEKAERDRKRKSSQDPLMKMEEYIEKKKHKHKHKDKDHHKSKKHKGKKVYQQKSSTKSIEQLRAERLEREKKKDRGLRNC